jgi:hypothetical protein
MSRGPLYLGALAAVAACQWIAPLPEERYGDAPGDAGESGRSSGRGRPELGGEGGGTNGGAGSDGAPNEQVGGASARAGVGGETETTPIPGGALDSTMPIAVASRERKPDGPPLPELEMLWTTSEGVHHLSRQDGKFGAQTNLGGAPALPPVALAVAFGRLDVFIAEANGSVKRRQLEDGVWEPPSSWEDHAGEAQRGFSATGDRERLDLFAVNRLGTISHRFWRRNDSGGSWSDWLELLGVVAAGRVAVASSRKDRVEIFVRDTKGSLFTQTYDRNQSVAGWNGHWAPVEPCKVGQASTCPCQALVSDAEAVSIQTGRVDVVFNSGSLFHLWHTATEPWQCEPLHQTLAASSQTALLSRELGRLDLLVPKGDTISLRAWSGAQWSEWFSRSASFKDVAMTSPYASSLFVVGRTAKDRIEYLEWDSGTGWTR